jgi:hypothetical protein
MIETQGVGRRHQFLATHFCGSPAAHFPDGEMHAPGPIALIFQLEEEPTTPNLRVIRMCANRQDIDGHLGFLPVSEFHVQGYAGAFSSSRWPHRTRTADTSGKARVQRPRAP